MPSSALGFHPQESYQTHWFPAAPVVPVERGDVVVASAAAIETEMDAHAIVAKTRVSPMVARDPMKSSGQ